MRGQIKTTFKLNIIIIIIVINKREGVNGACLVLY